MDDNELPSGIHVESIFGQKTQKGLVRLVLTNGANDILMTPEEARNVAMDLLQTCTAAEMDEVLMLWLGSHTDGPALEDGQKALILRDLRSWRKRRRAAQDPVRGMDV